MTDTPAASAVQTLLDQERDLRAAVALTQETLETQRLQLAAVRHQLAGVRLGQQLATETAAASANG